MMTDVFDMVTTLAVNRLNLVIEIFQRIDFFKGPFFGADLLADPLVFQISVGTMALAAFSHYPFN